MLKVLKDKFLSLGRDEDGAALVVTLAIFFLMYLGCMGVYAVSMSVKERIQLQNAVDAAAYSAAVVQADTLSRIATINRAMSWTYVQMTREQMDYIVYKWLKHTCKHYDYDKSEAVKWVKAGSPCGRHTLDYHISRIYLNGHDNLISSTQEYGISIPTRASIGTAVSAFAALHPLTSLKSSIRQDKRNISRMNKAIEDLLSQMHQKIAATVTSVLWANLAHTGSSDVFYLLQQEKPNKYMRILKNNYGDETQFLSFSRYGSVKKTFDKGIDDWFVRGNEKEEEGGDGIQRSYNHAREGRLYSQWDWHATKWICFWVPYKWIHIPIPKLFCDHSHERDECRMSLAGVPKTITQSTYEWEEVDTPPSGTKKWPYDSKNPEDGSNMNKYSDYYREETTTNADGSENTHYYVLKETEKSYTIYVPDAEAALDLARARIDFTATCYADNDEIYDDYYIGEKAKPYVLDVAYFGEKGTISVGVRQKNENVFRRLLKGIGGIFTAFDPDWNDDAETHTYVFASAKAAYRHKGSTQSQSDYGERAYRIDWDSHDQAWNLCQSDWDAVFVPVRRAASSAKRNGSASKAVWSGTDEGLLKDWVASTGHWHRLNGQVLDDYDSWEQITVPRGVLVGNEHGGTLNWRKLGRVMFH